MSDNSLSKYLPREQTEAQRQKSHGYRRGFGRHVDGTRTAENIKREQLAAQRRARIRAAIDAGTQRFAGEAYGSKNGEVIDPLTGDDDAIEKAWRDEFGGGDR